MTEYLTFPARTLRDFAATIMQSGGFTAEEAAITADSLILSNLLGHDSHGVMRVTEYMSFLKNGELFSGKQLETLKETENSLWVNGHYGLGQVQMSRFLDKLAAKAKTQAIVCGAMQDCAHIGRLGEWSERLGARGFAAIVCANDNGTLQFVTPPGGKQGRTSANPMALAIPLADKDVFSLDISTSAVAVGKIKLAYQSGERVAEGLLKDAEGNPTTDPSVIFEEPKGTLQSFGGAQSYKGFGLSMFVDLLVAGLSGGFAPPAPDGTLASNNVTVTLWNPEYFAGLAHMQEEAEKYLDFVRQTESAPGKPPVRVAGDRAKQEKSKREANGIAISRGTLEKLVRLAGHCNAVVPDAITSKL